MYLRQSTAQAVNFGPFVDSTDGVTAETGLTISQADMQLSKDGGTYAQKSAAGNATHDTDGHYTTTLSTTDTATVGELKLQVNAAGALPVWERWYVVEEAVYDDLFAASATGVPTAVENRAEIDSNSTQLAAIIADTNELQADWVNGGRLDLILDSRASQASVDTIDGIVDAILTDTDAIIPALISGLNDFDPASENVSIGAILGEAITETTAGRIAQNLSVFFDNADAASTQTQDDVGGGSSLTLEDIADAVWDEVLTNGTHNVVNSAGRRLRELETGAILHADDTQAGSTTSEVVLANAASTIDNFYKHDGLEIQGEDRLILSYVGSTRTATLDSPLLGGAPSNNTPYQIMSGRKSFSAAQRLGYTDDEVFINTLVGESGAVQEINGIQDNPSDNIADATTIADNHDPVITVFNISAGSSITPAQTYSNWQWLGRAATIALNGQQYPNNTFQRHFLSGNISAATASQFRVLSCQTSGAVEWPMNVAMGDSGINGNITFNAAGTANIFNCINPSGVTIDCGSAITTGNVSFINHNAPGGITFSNITGTQVVAFFGTGQVTLDSSCTGGTFIFGGDVTLTDNSAGATVSGLAQQAVLSNTNSILTDTGITIPDQISALNDFDPSAETVDVGAINGSTLAAIRLALSAGSIVTGEAITGTLSTTEMTTDLTEATDDHYNGRIIIWTSGVLKDQATDITDYTGSTKLLTYTATTEAPSNGDTFIIV